jgi:hypothetical protein
MSEDILTIRVYSCQLQDLVGSARKFGYSTRALPSSVVAINHEFASDEQVIAPDAEVALFPPVSGGSSEFPTVVSVTEATLDLDDLLAQITLPSTGAASIFSGMVRGITTRTDPHETIYLNRSLHSQEKPMHQVATETGERFRQFKDHCSTDRAPVSGTLPCHCMLLPTAIQAYLRRLIWN